MTTVKLKTLKLKKNQVALVFLLFQATLQGTLPAQPFELPLTFLKIILYN